jgi:homoserine dehydrogenase
MYIEINRLTKTGVAILFIWATVSLGMDMAHTANNTAAGKCPVVIVGFGTIGKAVVKKILQERTEMFTIRGLFTSGRCLIDEHGISAEAADRFGKSETSSRLEKKIIQKKEHALISSLKAPFIVVDTTSDDATFPLLELTLARGGYVVTANKKPLAAEHEKFDRLMNTGSERLLYRTTVGAGLPVLSTLKKLLNTHIEIESIRGVFSGTLGFIFSKINAGIPFSVAVSQAYAQGLTEPHPKEDLSGNDVARKLLIVARTMGVRAQLCNVQVSHLYDPAMENLNPAAFLEKMSEQDSIYYKSAGETRKLCYIASIAKITTGKYKLEAKIELVDKSSPFFDLRGPENMFVFTLKNHPPIVIRGFGAGAITVERLFDDICAVGNLLSSGRTTDRTFTFSP